MFSFFSVVKPLVVDGSAQSHVLYLAYDEVCLTELHPPVVLQEFVNHGKFLRHLVPLFFPDP